MGEGSGTSLRLSVEHQHWSSEVTELAMKTKSNKTIPSFPTRRIPCGMGTALVFLGFIMLISTWVYNNDHPDEPQCAAIEGSIHSWFKTLGYSTISLGLMLLTWSGGIAVAYKAVGCFQEAFFFYDTCYGAFGRFLVISVAAIHMVINGYGHGIFYRAHNHPNEDFRVQTEHEEHRWNYCAPGIYNFALAANVIIAITWVALIAWAVYSLYVRFGKDTGVSRKVFSEEKWGRAEKILRAVGIDNDGELKSVTSK